MAVDGQNIVEPGLIGVRESESEVRFGVKGKKTMVFSRCLLLVIDGQNIVGPRIIGVRESESEVRFGVKGQKNIVLVDDYCWPLMVGRVGLGVIGLRESESEFRFGVKGQKNIVSKGFKGQKKTSYENPFRIQKKRFDHRVIEVEELKPPINT